MTEDEKKQMALLYEVRALPMELSAEQDEKLRALEKTFIEDEVKSALMAHVLPLLHELHGEFVMHVETDEHGSSIDVHRKDGKPAKKYVRPEAPTPSAQEPELLAPEKAGRRPRFRFSMVGISIGEWVTFDPTGLRVKVVADQEVEYDGRQYKLSPFVRAFLPENERNACGAYQGAKYFSYNGRTLDSLRTDREGGK